MRITDSILFRTVKRSMQKNAQQVMKEQEKVSSGKRVNRPSDDPLGAMRAQQLYSDMSKIEQYDRNNMFAKMWMNETEATINDAMQIVTRLKQLAVGMGSDSYNNEASEAAAKEVEVLQEHLLALANSRNGNKSIFAGHQVDKPAFLPDGTFNGDDGDILVNIDEDVTVQLNLSGQDVFQSGPSQNIFATLDDFVTALNSNDAETVRTQVLDELDTNFSALQRNLAEIGARVNSLDKSLESHELVTEAKVRQLGNVEEIDVFEVVTDLETARNTFRASLLNARDIGNLSLVNFLR